MELDEGPPDHASSTWGGERASAWTCIFNVSKSASFLRQPQSPETAGRLKKCAYRKTAGAASQAPSPHVYLLSRKDESVLPKHGSELVDIERLETIPGTDAKRGCSAPVHQPKTPSWVILSLFGSVHPQRQHLHTDTLAEPGEGAGWRRFPGCDSQGST